MWNMISEVRFKAICSDLAETLPQGRVGGGDCVCGCVCWGCSMQLKRWGSPGEKKKCVAQGIRNTGCLNVRTTSQILKEHELLTVRKSHKSSVSYNANGGPLWAWVTQA